MRIIFIIILLPIALNMVGQVNFCLDTCSSSIDSLYGRLSSLNKLMQKCDPNIPNPNSAYKYNFKKYGKDSSVIIFLDSLDKMLFRKVNKFDKQGCRWWEEDEVYNSLGKLSYREARKWSCLKPDNKNNADSNNFDALLYERERLTYDESGRVKERIWFYISTNVVKKYTYTYNQNNNQTCHITKHNCNSFWEL